MRGGSVLDLNAYGAAAREYELRTGRLLTIAQYFAIIEGSPAPMMTVILAAEFARQNADAQADHDEYRAEMSIGGQNYDPNETPFQMSRGRKV